MPKNGKRNVRTVNLADFWDPEQASQTAAPPQRNRLHRPPPPRPVVDSQALKRAYMLQHFQFVLRADLLSLKSSGGGGTLPQGQRKLMECLRSADSLVPWTAVQSVVMRATLAEFECPICLDTPTAPRITECGHVFCMPCVLQYLYRRKQTDEPRTCPVCHGLIGAFMLRPVVLQPITALKVCAETEKEPSPEELIRFDLFRRERNSCILHRYDDPRMTEHGRSAEYLKQLQQHPPSGVSGGGGIEHEVCLPFYGEPCAVHSRYVISTPEFEATQRYLDGASISERLHDVELLERPMSEYDTAEEHFLLEALNEVTKEPEALAPSLVKCSPPLAPRPASGSGTPNVGGGADMRSPQATRGSHTDSASAGLSTSAHLGRGGGNGGNPSSNASAANPVYEIYAEGNGQPYYLHMVSVKMLKHDAKLRDAPLPETVSGRVLDIASFTQNDESRRIYKVFAHVPLHGNIQLCLLDLSNTVLPETMAAFKQTLDDMERRRQEQRYADAMSDNGTDASWQAYLKRYSVHSYDSPAILPSEVSLGTAEDSVTLLQLPSAGSGWEDHGLPPNTLDTRQRATKRQECGPDSLVPQPPPATLVTLASLTGTFTPTPPPPLEAHVDPQPTQGVAAPSSSSSCWGDGSAARLFRPSANHSQGGTGPSGAAAIVSTWGGHAFTSSPAMRNSSGDGGGGSLSVGGAGTTPKTQQPSHHQKQQLQQKSPQSRKQ